MDFAKDFILRLLVLLLFVDAAIFTASGQSTGNYVPNVIPPSPNAAALMKFTDVPVSPYTGTADVTVPIYTIQAKGITVPVNLAYHTGGIKLKEEASWVGLGWALNAGGAISRTIMDQDDFGTGGPLYFTTSAPQIAGDMTGYHPSQYVNETFGNYFVDFYCNYLENTTGGNQDFYNAFHLGTPAYDMEPDIYSYNFPGHSGKFIITRKGQPVLQKQENIVIQFQSGGQSFTITDDQGNKFYFNVTETCQGVGAAKPVTSWLLSKIITQQQDSVLFNYVAGGSGVNVVPDVYQYYNYSCNGGLPTTGNNAPTLYNNQTLQSIDFSNGHLQFVTDGNRSDLNGAYKLDSVLIYSKNSAGTLSYLKQNNFYYSYFNQTPPPGTDTFEYKRLKLDSVKEISGGLSLPPYSFIYNNPNPGSGSAKHSFSVDHWGYYNGAANGGYSNGTVTGTLLPTSSISFNPPILQSAGSTIFTYNGANRESNSQYTQTFSLQQITYPTGGSSVFAYQVNDYDWSNSRTGPNDMPNVVTLTIDSVINVTHHGTTSGTIDLTTIYPILQAGSGQSNLTIKVTFLYQNNYTIPNFPYENSSNKLTFSFAGTGQNLFQDVNGSTCQSGSPACSVNIPDAIVPPGVYTWSAYIDPTIDTAHTYSETHIDFQYQYLQQTYNQQVNNNYISNASGLRIQSITNYTSAGIPASEKIYSYTYSQDKTNSGTPQQYSYGRLMSFPSYARYTYNFNTATSSDCIGINLYSSSNTALTSVIQGNIVGYDQVTEASVDPVTGIDIGKTIYKYYNSSDSTYTYDGFRLPGTLNMGNSLNGMLLLKSEYANNNGVYQKVAETDNFFHTTNRSVYNSPKYQYFNTIAAKFTSGCPVDTAVTVETFTCFYPSLKSERILSDSTYDYTYDQNNPLNYVLTVNRSYYDNPLHYQVTRNNRIDSKGNSLTTFLKYPQDYLFTGQQWTGNTIIDTMIEKNMVSETIEKQDSLYYTGSQTGYVTGAQLSLYRLLANSSHTVVPDKIYKLDVQSPITNFQPFAFSGNSTSIESRYRQMASFDQFDAFNDMSQYTTTDQNPVSIIWDYTSKYPIAQVKNAVITDVAATSFEADGYGNWTAYTGTITKVTTAPFPPTGNNYYNLTTSATLSKSGLVSGNVYIVSYWSANGSYSVTGGTGSYITGKTINGWTYYEHKITSTSTTITISGTGAIDEVRLYPATALMTTYTYAPLFGMATTCDPDNKVTYNYYDVFGRLKWVKDQDGNIIKTYQYHYLGKPTIF